MAITKKDLVELQESLTKSLSQMWRSDLRVALAQQRDDIKHDIRDEMDAKFLASDKRMDQKLDNLRVEFAEIISDCVLPQIDSLHEELGGVKKDISTLKEDVSSLKSDVSALKKDAQTVKHDMHTIHKDLKHDIANIHLHVGMAT